MAFDEVVPGFPAVLDVATVEAIAEEVGDDRVAACAEAFQHYRAVALSRGFSEEVALKQAGFMWDQTATAPRLVHP